ncbi:hypothetical protein LV779_39220 [Streptomyces thinghirensis]|nr:hypothetical protein [Streptomyces thinghirensis]
MRADLRRPFELAAGPSSAPPLYTLGDGRNALLLTFHHMVSTASPSPCSCAS